MVRRITRGALHALIVCVLLAMIGLELLVVIDHGITEAAALVIALGFVAALTIIAFGRDDRP